MSKFDVFGSQVSVRIHPTHNAVVLTKAVAGGKGYDPTDVDAIVAAATRAAKSAKGIYLSSDSFWLAGESFKGKPYSYKLSKGRNAGEMREVQTYSIEQLLAYVKAAQYERAQVCFSIVRAPQLKFWTPGEKSGQRQTIQTF